MNGKVIAILTLMATLQNIGYSILGTFYPFESQSRGVSEITLGVIVASYSIAYIISAGVSGKYLSTIGQSTGLKYGLLMSMVQQFGLGSLKHIGSDDWFVRLSVLAQSIGGVGAGLNVTCAIAIITSHFPNDREQNLGLIEGGTGLGMLIGPLIGSGLYIIGGYCVPFWTLGCTYLIIFPCVKHITSTIQSEDGYNNNSL